MTVPSGSGRGVLPARRMLMPRETINWIAFGQAIDSDLSGHSEARRRWPLGEGNAFYRPMDLALLEMFGGPPLWKPAEPQDELWVEREPKWVAVHRRLARDLVQQTGREPSALYVDLCNDLDAVAGREEAYKHAQAELIEALAAGRLSAIGRLTVIQDDGQRTFTAARNPEELPPLTFEIERLAFDPSGALMEANVQGAVAVGVKFRTAQVAQVWPPAQGQGAGGAAQQPQPHPLRRDMEAWYRKRVQTWPPGKPAPSEREDQAAAARAFPSVSRERVRELRASLAPERWRRPGPRNSRGKDLAGPPRD